MLRLYINYDLLLEAAMLAVEYIQAVLGNGREYFGLKVIQPASVEHMKALLLYLYKGKES